ncbi:hypothetical protein EDD40_1826 [Saccharothrix texasensis]|uniref:Uncharacterized protein n=1 Tax=Saccharothrix texasensis TaxID=103734 RepID=A0A3N1H2S5_9PSEU|nr:hypothetical protein EDD40_1826 [Saccharothrix texasensis]
MTAPTGVETTADYDAGAEPPPVGTTAEASAEHAQPHRLVMLGSESGSCCSVGGGCL